MSHIMRHPAPGFGDLMEGWHVVPQNPIRDAGTPMVPSLQAAAGGRVVRRPRLAELMPGTFVVPQNPLRDAITKGMGCTSCGCSGLGGLGDGTITDWFQGSSLSDSLAIPNWVMLGAGAMAVLWLWPGKKKR